MNLFIDLICEMTRYMKFFLSNRCEVLSNSIADQVFWDKFWEHFIFHLRIKALKSKINPHSSKSMMDYVEDRTIVCLIQQD